MNRTLLILALVAAGGCAVTKIPYPMGGSRADGVVTMAFEYGEFERPVVDFESAKFFASKKCAAWGYADAEAFGGQTSTCQAANQYGCLQYHVEMQYQCTGSPSRQAAQPAVGQPLQAEHVLHCRYDRLNSMQVCE